MKATLLLLAALATLAQDERSMRDAIREASGRPPAEEGPAEQAPAEDTAQEAEQDPALRPLPALPAAPLEEVVRVQVELTPAEADIGQPIELALVLEHPAEVEVFVKDAALELDDSWLRLEDARVVREDTPRGRRTRARWVVASLEAGERALELRPGRYERDGTIHVLEPRATTVRVRPALDEGEDAPRPTSGFQPAPEGAEPDLSALWWSAGSLVVALVAAGAFFVRARLRGAPPAPAGPTPRARIDALVADGVEAPERLAELHYELSAALRALLDARADRDRRGATDAEWLVAVAHDPGLEPAQHAALSDLLSACARVKYGQERATRWAVDETLGRARELAAALAEPAAPSKPAAPSDPEGEVRP